MTMEIPHNCNYYKLINAFLAFTLQMEPTATVHSLTDKTENPSVLCHMIKSWDIVYSNTGRFRNMRYLLVDTEVHITTNSFFLQFSTTLYNVHYVF